MEPESFLACARGLLAIPSTADRQAMVFRDLAGRMDYPIALQLVTDEEVGGRDGTLHHIEHGVSDEFVIIGEQSRLRVVTESRRLLTAYFQAEGRSGHSTYQWLGDNAILKLMSSLDKLLGSYPVATEEIWRTTINLARIETTNSAVNRAPADAQAWWDIRFPTEDTDLNGRTVNEITEHRATFGVPGVTVAVISVGPPHWVDRSPAPRGTAAAARCPESWCRGFTFLLPTRHRCRHLRYRWRWLARPARVRRHHHGRAVLLGTHRISHRPGLLRPVTRPPVAVRGRQRDVSFRCTPTPESKGSLNVSSPGTRYPARVSIQSRECSPELLERLSGATLFPERQIGTAIVNTICRGGGSLLVVTAPGVIDADEQIDYFLSLIPEEWEGQRDSWRNRLALVSVADSSARWLSDKVMDRDNPDAAAVRAAIRDFVDRERTGGEVQLSYFEPSANLERLARNLNIPGDQADSQYISLGTKASGRELFKRVGIDVPVGIPPCHTLAQLAEGVAELLRRGHRKLLLKLSSTEYGAGQGNALLDLSMLEHSGDQSDLVTIVLECLSGATLMDDQIGWTDFVEMITRSGVIAEEFVEGEETCSPSFQGRISTDGRVKTLSTHDQLLGGSGQTYIGSSFPADDDYRAAVISHGIRVGRLLCDQGVRHGDYGVDFIAVWHGTSWRVLGCELNLRTTATKHGFTMVSGLLDVSPDDSGRLFVDGSERVYEASDGIADSRLIGLRPRELIQFVQDSPLRYDQDRKTGAVLHLMSTLVKYGKFGAVCIGRDRMEAKCMMRELREIVVGFVES